MIKFNSRFDEYAYRVGTFDVTDGLVVEEGMWVQLDSSTGKIVLPKTAGTKAYMAVGSTRVGRNQVAGKAITKIAFLIGSFSVWTDQAPASGVAPMAPLTSDTTGKLKAASGTDVILAHALRQSGGFTQIISA